MSAPDQFHLTAVPPPRVVLPVPNPRATVDHATGERVILVPVPGHPGQPGPPGEGVQIFREQPAGAVDGVNTVFTTAFTYQPTRVEVFLNGLNEIHFTESGPGEITFGEPPESGDIVRVNYIVQ